MAGIIQKGQKNLIFIVLPKQRKQLNALSTTYERKQMQYGSNIKIMNNNYNSKNNNDKIINDNDNDSSNITSLILENNVFSHHVSTYLN